MGIIRRLALIIVILSAALVALGVFSYKELTLVQTTAITTKDSRVMQLRQAAAVELNVTRVSLQLRHAMLARTPAEAEAAYKDIADKRALIASILKDYEARIISPKGREVFSKIPALVDAFWIKGTRNLELIQQGHKDEAFAFLVDETIPARNHLLKALDTTVSYQTQALSDDIQNISNTINLTLLLQLSAFAAIFVMLIGFAWWLKQSLQQRIAQSGSIARATASGDLTIQRTEAIQDEFTPLMDSLHQMQLSLTHVVSNVRAAANSVSAASQEIAAGNQDLSSRTERQASSVQQTVSTMEQLNAMARQNADNAVQAKQLAAQASTIAREGGDAMEKVVSTMGDIASGSRKIAEIIEVIDSIAFQTNILALNAAVEAARAGEQGRGFAVVASEVRALAQRSALAAREIGSLIQSSTDQVQRGSELVSHAGATMHQVVESIQKVDHIMEDIRDAGTLQARGLQGINTAIESIDQSTQQNAALVEQSSASADVLRQRANELVQAVSVFRLMDQANHTAYAAAPQALDAARPLALPA